MGAVCRRWTGLICLLLASTSLGAAAPGDRTGPATAPATQPSPFLLHLPGIGGIKWSDRQFVRGLHDANFAGTIQVFDWTANDPGMDALLAYKRNHNQARKIAGILAQRRAADPAGKLLLTSHSGGGGLAIWALEDLPPGVMVDDALLMSPALSPTYDLSRALSHVSGHLYVFSSLADLFVLGTGTRVFGTIDGVKTDAAGRVGFIQPATADPQQYKKLISEPYDPSWMKYNDFGDHIGGMTRLFSRNVLAPLLLSGKLPPVSMPTTAPTPTGLGRALPTSLPATQPSAMR
jgi:hypothetical protein